MSLEIYRKEIDGINKDILKLFEQRCKVVDKVAEYKKEHNIAILNQGREDAIINEMCALTEQRYKSGVKVLFNTLMSISREYQYNQNYKNTQLYNIISSVGEGAHNQADAQGFTVGCQGVDGSFSTNGANQIFDDCKISYFENFEDVFEALKDKIIDIGVLPIENSFSGSVTKVYDLLRTYGFYITHCKKIKVEHYLLSKDAVDISDIKKVYSHEQALMQCSEFFDKNPHIKREEFSNTAAAAKMVSLKPENNIAAIASKECSDIYGLNIVEEGVQNKAENYTRFISISRNFIQNPNANKISVCLNLPNKEGSLYNILSRFAINGFNLTKIESRPMENHNFAFSFFLDFEGNIINEQSKKFLCQLSHEIDGFAFLGNYFE